MNEAARKVGKKNESSQVAMIQSMDELLITEVDQDKKLFAFVDSKHFDDVSIIDTVKTVEEIRALDDYKSIQEVISQHKEENYTVKKLYKMRESSNRRQRGKSGTSQSESQFDELS